MHRQEVADRYFLFLEPRSLCDSGEIAKNLARCKGVEEVHVTSGRYGFIVSANANSRNSIRSISSKVMKASRIRAVSVAASHLVYRK